MKTQIASSNNMLIDSLSVPLNDTSTAKIDINSGAGNLTIDSLTADEPALASGALQYFEKQGPPSRTLDSSDSQATLTLRGGNAIRPRFRFPWSACNGAVEWEIHLNPTVLLDITAHSGGGNVKLNLAGMNITRLEADTGGGNVDVVLPDNTADLSVVAKTGGGNVSVEIGSGIQGISIINAGSGAGSVIVQVPSGIAAKIYANSGMGKVTVDSRFNKIDKNTYQSSDFDSAADKVEITANSGAGNVIVNTK